MDDLNIDIKPNIQIVQIKCTNCGHIGKPKKWEHRNIVGILLISSPLLMLIYFVFTNPYVCGQCKKRNHLIKILNNKKEIPIKCLSNKNFFIIFIFSFTISIIWAILLLN